MSVSRQDCANVLIRGRFGDAGYGLLTRRDDAGPAEEFLSSGLTSAAVQRLWDRPDASERFEHPGNSAGPPRLPDPTARIRAPVLSASQAALVIVNARGYQGSPI